MISFLEVLYIDEDISNKVIELKRKNKIKLPGAIIINKANDIRLKNINKLKLKIVGI